MGEEGDGTVHGLLQRKHLKLGGKELGAGEAGEGGQVLDPGVPQRALAERRLVHQHLSSRRQLQRAGGQPQRATLATRPPGTAVELQRVD